MIDTFAADIARFAAHRAAEDAAEDELAEQLDLERRMRADEQTALEWDRATLDALEMDVHDAGEAAMERRWRNVSLTDQAEREMDQERSAMLRWWISGGGPTVAEVDAHGRPFTAAELRRRFERSR